MKKEDQKVIFHINTVGNSGSTRRIAEGICKLARKKYNAICYTAYGRWSNKSESTLIKIGNKFSVYFHVALTRLFDKHGMGSKIATWKLINKIKQVKPDIIHLHNIHGYYLNYPILFSYLSNLKIPIVWTLHDCWAYTGHCVHYTITKCDKWKSECFSCPNLKDYPNSWGFDSSKNNYRNKKHHFTQLNDLTLVTVSNWLANQVKESFLSKYPVVKIYNGIDIDVFSPQTVNKSLYGCENKTIILGVATVWNERKGLQDFIRLANSLNDNYRIILVGLSKKQIKTLPDNIIGLEKTENITELVKLYSLADLYINFSVEETFGLTTVESLACGTPVIVVNSTASPEIINEEVGYVIEPHDIDSALSNILDIRRKGKQYYSEKCRLYAIERFNETNLYEEYLTLYKQLLDNENISNNDNIQ